MHKLSYKWRYLIVGLVGGGLSFGILVLIPYSFEKSLLNFVGILSTEGPSLSPLSPMRWAAGIGFGIVVLFYFYFLERIPKSFMRVVVWIIGSVLAYGVAVAMILDIEMGGFFGAGMVGAAMMLAVFSFSFFRVSLLEFCALVLAGGFLGLSIYLPSDQNFMILYIVWQAGMMFGLGVVRDGRDKEQKKEVEKLIAS